MTIAYQNQWPAVPATALTANGGADGLVSIANTDGFYVLQQAKLVNSAGNLPVQILEIISPTQMYVGLIGQMDKRYRASGANVSAYTTATSSTIEAAQQNKRLPSPNALLQAVLEAEPVSALREVQVDARGQPLFAKGPLVALRASAVLTNAYVASATLDTMHANTVVVLTSFTKGSLTNAMLRFDISDDGTTWYPAETVDNGSTTVAADEAQVNQFAKVHVLTVGAPTTHSNVIRTELPGGALAKYFRARVLGTGTVTSSLAKIDAYACVL